MQESNTDVNEESDSHSDATGSGQQNIEASNENQSVPNLSKEWIATRHIFAFLGFLGFANVYAMRVNLSVAIVAMVNSSAIPQRNSTSDDVCPLPTNGSIAPVKEGKFDWDESVQGIILGSFFWGYIVTNPIGGRLGDIFGGKKVFFFGVLFTSLLTLLIPLASYISPYALTALRVCIGLAEGVTFPSMNSMMAKWIPPLERSQTSSFIFAGAQAGIVFSFPLAGLMCDSSFMDGWPMAFYVFGGLGLVWCFFWMILIHESPSTHPRISPEEKLYINSSLRTNKAYFKKMPLPFKEIITSVPFWAILAAHVCQNWGYYFLLTELPTYMKNILHFDIKANSFFSALPYLVMWIVSVVMGFIIDSLRRKGKLATLSARRIANSIGFYCPMICLVLAAYSGCNTKLTLGLLTLGVGLNGATLSGYMNSHLDIASNYAGTLMGLTNCVATIPGFVAPIVVGSIISGQETLSQWRIVFWIAAVIFFIGNTIYIIFISSDEQPWNNLYSSSEIVADGNDYGSLLTASVEDEQILRSER
ncbi:putative inorganic phosphate cotransporter [Armadillidium nasatum]|uniref:Sialin n=1 Tax=Armadillidium nasatum TaxID=96803 RepID=A0A5N5TJ28_9CRUS|nr:putative inorganic phosphate cotransporter [Armadillidium nasatum]